MKNDTADAWERVSNPAKVPNVFIPLEAEPIFYKTTDINGYSTFMMKIGDGKRTAEELPYFGIGSSVNEVATNEEINALFNEFPSFAFVATSNSDINELFKEGGS